MDWLYLQGGCPFLAVVLRRVRHRASGVTFMPKAGSREHLGTGCVMLTWWAPREVGLLEIPEGRVWCWEHCGSTAQPPALAHEEQPHSKSLGWPMQEERGRCPQMTLALPASAAC